MPFTLLADGDVLSVGAVVDGSRVLVRASDLARATGWVLKPEGLCREAMCVPLRDPSVATADGQRIDLQGFAAALQRPVAIDVEESSAFLGVAASSRAEQLRGMQAPDFALPDLSGRVHSLGEHRGKKVLLLAYASW
jgi:hypothetical protein